MRAQQMLSLCDTPSVSRGGYQVGQSLFSVRAWAVTGLAALVCFLFGGCARPSHSSNIGETNDERVSILEAEQVVASKRTSYERAVLGLELLGKDSMPLSWCTSVLIRPDVVLTAGHCFDPNLIVGFESARMQQTTNLKTAVPGDSGARRIIQIIMHPEFDSHGGIYEGVRQMQHDHDLALAILSRPVDSSIVPQRLVAANEPIKPGQKVMIYGFGRSVDYNQISNSPVARHYLTLQKAFLILSDEMLHDRVFSQKDQKSSLCQGDSGGPGFILPTKKNPLATVVSINSGAKGSEHPMFKQRLCKGQSVVQPVAPYREWIDRVLKEIGR